MDLSAEKATGPDTGLSISVFATHLAMQLVLLVCNSFTFMVSMYVVGLFRILLTQSAIVSN